MVKNDVDDNLNLKKNISNLNDDNNNINNKDDDGCSII